MNTLSENIKLIDSFIKMYKVDCSKWKSLIHDVKRLAPTIYSRTRIDGSLSRIKFNEDTFYKFDEVKGVNIFLIQLLKDYKNILQELDFKMNKCSDELLAALKSFDNEVLDFEPMSEYAKDMFDQDRYNILRPLKSLTKLKEEILSDKFSIEKINLEIKEREDKETLYKNYTLENINLDQEKLNKELSDLINLGII